MGYPWPAYQPRVREEMAWGTGDSSRANEVGWGRGRWVGRAWLVGGAVVGQASAAGRGHDRGVRGARLVGGAIVGSGERGWSVGGAGQSDALVGRSCWSVG